MVVLGSICKDAVCSPKLPFWVFQSPIIAYVILVGLAKRSPAFFTNVNPGIRTGGFVNDGKDEYLKGLSPELLPKTVLMRAGATLADVEAGLARHGIGYPLIMKPNVGELGRRVRRIADRAALIEQLAREKSDFLLQEFVDYPLEFGVLYYRDPSTGESGISSVGVKDMPYVTGDGIRTVRQLSAAKYPGQDFGLLDAVALDCVPHAGRTVRVGYIGHRGKGSVFRNAQDLNRPKLVAVFAAIARNIDGFCFGRFDVKAKSVDDLLNGRDIKILEVNGVASQPNHIYDCNISLWGAYHALIDHWRLIARISRENSRLGFKPMGLRALIREIQEKQTA